MLSVLIKLFVVVPIKVAGLVVKGFARGIKAVRRIVRVPLKLLKIRV